MGPFGEPVLSPMVPCSTGDTSQAPRKPREQAVPGGCSQGRCCDETGGGGKGGPPACFMTTDPRALSHARPLGNAPVAKLDAWL